MSPLVDKAPRFDSAVPQFAVPDVVTTAEYYRDVLGFEIAGYWDGERQHRDPKRTALFGIVHRDQVEMFFNRADESTPPVHRAAGGYDVYFHVTGVDALAEEFRAHGATILDGPRDQVYAQRELAIRDVNGLILAFGEGTCGRAT